jgi:hypothetical protein
MGKLVGFDPSFFCITRFIINSDSRVTEFLEDLCKAAAAIALAFLGEDKNLETQTVSLSTVKSSSIMLTAELTLVILKALADCSSLKADFKGTKIEGRPIVAISAIEEAPERLITN